LRKRWHSTPKNIRSKKREEVLRSTTNSA